MKKVNDYYVNRHSCFLLQYHLVFVTKYRKKVMKDEIRERMLELFNEYFEKWKFPILQMEICPDHIHILFEASPSINLSNYVNGLKTWTSKKIRHEFFEKIKEYYCKPYFWSLSYFIASVSERSTEVVRRYIENQNGD